MLDSFQPQDGSPQWFLDNIRHPGKPVCTAVAGTNVHMLTWNWERTDLPTLMLVHGFGAHAHWWSFLAPFFSDQYRVAAIDLPGMGDSEPPASYADSCFASAITGCITANQLQPVYIVGHSFGGAQSLRAMAMSPELFRHGIIVDTNIRLSPEPPIRNLLPKGSHKQSPTRAECIARFRLMPPQPNYIAPLIHYIAHHSCTSDDQGWHWKSDPDCINVGEIDGPDILHQVKTPIDMIYGEKSFLNIENKPERVLRHFSQRGNLRVIPEAGHHIMIDHPLELVSAIKSLLAN